MPKKNKYFSKITNYTIHETYDYKVFKTMEGNRELIPAHLKRIKKSMNHDYLFTVIVVNSDYEIIDGQHRFEVCKELELPIVYVVVDDYGLNQVQRFNSQSKTWSMDDYMNSYCQSGNEHYIQYKKFKDKYGFGHLECRALLGGGGGQESQQFKNEQFKIYNYQEAVNNAEKIHMIKPYYDGYMRRSFVLAMLRVFKQENYNHTEFINKLKYQSLKLVDASSYRQYLSLINDIYNYRRRYDSRIILL